MHSCSALGVVWGGVGCDGVELGADTASSKGSKTVMAQIMTIFCSERFGSFYKCGANCVEEEGKSAGNTPAFN